MHRHTYLGCDVARCSPLRAAKSCRCVREVGPTTSSSSSRHIQQCNGPCCCAAILIFLRQNHDASLCVLPIISLPDVATAPCTYSERQNLLFSFFFVQAVSCSSNGLCEIADGSYDSVYIPRADMHLRKRCPIQVVDAAELSQEEFRRDFFMLGKPVIVRNATDNWFALSFVLAHEHAISGIKSAQLDLNVLIPHARPAFWMWSDEHLLEEHGDTMVTVGEIPLVWQSVLCFNV